MEIDRRTLHAPKCKTCYAYAIKGSSGTAKYSWECIYCKIAHGRSTYDREYYPDSAYKTVAAFKMEQAWKLFWECFSIGDDILIIDDDDNLSVGVLVEVYDTGCDVRLKKGSKAKFIEWEAVRFMAQPGFPVRRLHGADGSASIEKECGVEKAIRSSAPSCDDDGGRCRASFGDPHEIEAVSFKIINPGNDGDALIDTGFEEQLVLTARDGAVGILYDLGSVYHWETPND